MDSDKVTETPPVRNIPEYLRRIACLKRGLDAEQGGARALAFRGQAKHSWELESSAERRLNRSNSVGATSESFITYHEDLILACRRNRFDRGDGGLLHELELLANLQHHRAATGFIDFTRSALVALWFATESTPADGKVFVINTDNGQFREIKPDDIRDRSISEILRFETREDEDLELAHPSSEEGLRPSRDRPQFWHWIPANLNERILAQHSLFILGPLSSGRPDTKEIIIDSGSKARIREELRDVHDIDEESLFPDFVGFAYTQRHDAIYGPTATDYFRLARNAMQRGDYSLAIQLFDNAIRHDPNYRLAYTFRGNAYERLGDIDSAIEDYSKMIELGWNLPVAYHIRAEAFELLGDYHSAIEDYSKMIEIDSSSLAAYIKRAEAYEELGEFENAIRDFSEAIRLEPEEFEYIYALRAVLYLCLEHWDHAKADFATAKNMGLDIPDFFSSEYGSIGDFEERMRVQLPNDIVHIISG